MLRFKLKFYVGIKTVLPTKTTNGENRIQSKDHLSDRSEGTTQNNRFEKKHSNFNNGSGEQTKIPLVSRILLLIKVQ